MGYEPTVQVYCPDLLSVSISVAVREGPASLQSLLPQCHRSSLQLQTSMPEDATRHRQQ